MLFYNYPNTFFLLIQHTISYIYYSNLLLIFVTQYHCLLKKRDGTRISQIPEEEPLKLENQKKVISWRRIARAIEKNDFYMKRLCFAQTKTDDKELRELIHKWDNLLTKDTETTDKGLRYFIENEVIS